MTTPTTDEFADLIHDAALIYQSVRMLAPSGDQMFEQTEDSQQERAAKRAIREIGHRIFAAGGDDLMVEVYERANHKFGFRGIRGISAIWTGIGTWQA